MCAMYTWIMPKFFPVSVMSLFTFEWVKTKTNDWFTLKPTKMQAMTKGWIWWSYCRNLSLTFCNVHAVDTQVQVRQFFYIIIQHTLTTGFSNAPPSVSKMAPYFLYSAQHREKVDNLVRSPCSLFIRQVDKQDKQPLFTLQPCRQGSSGYR